MEKLRKAYEVAMSILADSNYYGNNKHSVFGDFDKNTLNFDEFSFDFIKLDQTNDFDINSVNRVSVKNKSIGLKFTFIGKEIKINENPPFMYYCSVNDQLEDWDRFQFAYKICNAANGDDILIRFSKKDKPEYKTIIKRFGKKISKDEYEKLDIHSSESIISFFKKIQ